MDLKLLTAHEDTNMLNKIKKQQQLFGKRYDL